MLHYDVWRVIPDVSKCYNVIIFSMEQSLTLKTKLFLSPETTGIVYPTTKRKIPEDLKRQFT